MFNAIENHQMKRDQSRELSAEENPVLTQGMELCSISVLQMELRNV